MSHYWNFRTEISQNSQRMWKYVCLLINGIFLCRKSCYYPLKANQPTMVGGGCNQWFGSDGSQRSPVCTKTNKNSWNEHHFSLLFFWHRIAKSLPLTQLKATLNLKLLSIWPLLFAIGGVFLAIKIYPNVNWFYFLVTSIFWNLLQWRKIHDKKLSKASNGIYSTISQVFTGNVFKISLYFSIYDPLMTS